MNIKDIVEEQAKGLLGNKIKWNFTKFLIDKEGNVVKRFRQQSRLFRLKTA
jgi:glutathione peroxidase